MTFSFRLMKCLLICETKESQLLVFFRKLLKYREHSQFLANPLFLCVCVAIKILPFLKQPVFSDLCFFRNDPDETALHHIGSPN